MSIIFCPNCKTETLLTKDNECKTGWRCDKCNKCCLEKDGLAFQFLKLDDTFVEEKVITKQQKTKRSKQLTIFDYL